MKKIDLREKNIVYKNKLEFSVSLNDNGSWNNNPTASKSFNEIHSTNVIRFNTKEIKVKSLF